MGEGLPVREVLDDVVAALDGGGAAVLQAPPGAGKTTLVPLALHRSSGGEGRIVVLEPRRIAARAAAARMADLLDEPVGRTVGWTTGDGREVSAATRVEVVTEGVLVRRLQRDPALEGTAAVVLDEFHERAVVADLALALSVEARAALRPDLSLLVMSATLDGERVAALLGGVPVITSEGRTFDVETVHRPVPADADPGAAVALAVRQVLAEADGDVLAFLPGRAEIERARAALQGCGAAVVPLYGALGREAQQAALVPARSGRRVVLATDIAESSLTVPGVRIVVDAGWDRRPRFDPATGMSGLRTVRVSRASADQRRGRAAREGPGLCVRLWPAHEALTPHSPPAVAEEDLAPMALEVAAWGTPVGDLALLDQPPAATWAAATSLLDDLGAVDADGRITDRGRAMADLPAHPRLAAMVLGAPPGLAGLAAEVAALLGERDVLIGGGTDLEERVAALHGRGRGQVDRAALARVRRTADRIARAAGVGRPAGGARAEEGAVGRLLALAYPDRIARRRGERRGLFTLASGRGAVLRDGDPLAGEALLAVATLDRGEQQARIFLAAALDPADVAADARDVDVVTWADGDVVAERQRRLGALVLGRTPLGDPPRDAVVAALLAGIRAEALRPLPWTRAATDLRDRLGHLHRGQPDPSAAGGWPPVDDDALLADLEGWLAPFLHSARRRADLARVDLPAALLARVPHRLAARIDELAPTHVTVPTGSRIRLDYAGERPVLAVRLQEVLGLAETPQVAGGPVLLHLLSPAGRPLQVTDDLGGFWTGSYHAVRAEMRGRYPKHPWPEDPLSARATRHTKNRDPDRGGGAHG